MIENKEIPKEQVLIEEPQQSEEQLTKAQIETQIKFWGAEIDKQTNFNDYKNAFDKYNYYRDLKLKLYK